MVEIKCIYIHGGITLPCGLQCTSFQPGMSIEVINGRVIRDGLCETHQIIGLYAATDGTKRLVMMLVDLKTDELQLLESKNIKE